MEISDIFARQGNLFLGNRIIRQRSAGCATHRLELISKSKVVSDLIGDGAWFKLH